VVLKVELPLDPGLCRVIAAVQAGAQAQGLDPLLIGAAARDLLLVNVFGQRVRRATKDVDFAVALASWEAFEQLKGRLISDHGFADETRQVQRLVFTAEGDGAGTTIDLVPFGGLQVNRHTLVWPPEMDVYMTVAGFTEALESAQLVELTDGLVVKVASLPGLAILKMFAWGDRRQRDARDAVDLYQLLRSYGEAGTSDRMSDPDQALDRWLALDCDEEKTGAWLMGKDCGLLAQAETAEALQQLWGDERRREQLLNGMVSNELGSKGARQRAEALLTLFLEGFGETM
jgi:predicted nucleotidyltransferase